MRNETFAASRHTATVSGCPARDYSGNERGRTRRQGRAAGELPCDGQFRRGNGRKAERILRGGRWLNRMGQYREQQAKHRGDEGRAFGVHLVRGRFQRAAGVTFTALILAVGGTRIAAPQNVGHQPRPLQQAVRCQGQPKHQEHCRNDWLQPSHMSIDSWFHQRFKEIPNHPKPYRLSVRVAQECVWVVPDCDAVALEFQQRLRILRRIVRGWGRSAG